MNKVLVVLGIILSVGGVATALAELRTDELSRDFSCRSHSTMPEWTSDGKVRYTLWCQPIDRKEHSYALHLYLKIPIMEAVFDKQAIYPLTCSTSFQVETQDHLAFMDQWFAFPPRPLRFVANDSRKAAFWFHLLFGAENKISQISCLAPSLHLPWKVTSEISDIEFGVETRHHELRLAASVQVEQELKQQLQVKQTALRREFYLAPFMVNLPQGPLVELSLDNDQGLMRMELVEYSQGQSFKITVDYNAHRELTFDFELKAKGVMEILSSQALTGTLGYELAFFLAESILGESVSAVVDEWNGVDEDYFFSDNYMQYRQLLAVYPRMQAASLTWSGRQLAKRGFYLESLTEDRSIHTLFVRFERRHPLTHKILGIKQ